MVDMRIKQLRVKAKMTQEELAERSGMLRCDYQKLEAGLEPISSRYLGLVAETLGVKAKALLPQKVPANTRFENAAPAFVQIRLSGGIEVCERLGVEEQDRMFKVLSGGRNEKGWFVFEGDQHHVAVRVSEVEEYCITSREDGRPLGISYLDDRPAHPACEEVDLLDIVFLSGRHERYDVDPDRFPLNGFEDVKDLGMDIQLLFVDLDTLDEDASEWESVSFVNTDGECINVAPARASVFLTSLTNGSPALQEAISNGEEEDAEGVRDPADFARLRVVKS